MTNLKLLLNSGVLYFGHVVRGARLPLHFLSFAARALGVDDAARSVCDRRVNGQAALRQLRLLLQSLLPQGKSRPCCAAACVL